MHKTWHLLFLLLISSNLFAQPEKAFPMLKTPFRRPANFKTNGVYMQKGPIKWSISHSLFLYDTGEFYSCTIHNSNITKTGEDFIKEYIQIIIEKRPLVIMGSVWGFYRINNDTLTTWYSTRESNLQSWELAQSKFLIKEYTLHPLTFKQAVLSRFEKTNESLKRDTAAYVFYPATIKPDSARAWFYKVDWYQKYK